MTHAMMSSFEAACIILNKKKLIVPREVADSTAKQLLDHPLNLNKIRYFKKYKQINTAKNKTGITVPTIRPFAGCQLNTVFISRIDNPILNTALKPAASK